jgi:gentisate 1,2-dioxygenase
MNARDQHAHSQVGTDDAFHRMIHSHHIHGLWEVAAQKTPHPEPQAIPYIWRWSLMSRIVDDSCVAVPVGDERRAMQLFNPGLGGEWSTTGTLIAAVQVLMPGESARAHRHSPSAIRFVMCGDGAYTAVEGEKLVMHKGDLVLTPNWQWHDHGNETDEVVVWMDGLDVPLTKALGGMFFEMGTEQHRVETKPVGESRNLYARARMTPTWIKDYPRFSPLAVYSYEQAREALHALRDHDGSPYEGVALEFTHPHTGASALLTMRCQMHLIRPGQKLKARRVVGTSIFNVVQGTGRTIVDGVPFDWSENDILALPSWAMHEHHNTGSEDAILFSMNDHPVIEKLGFWREEVLTESGGHQRVRTPRREGATGRLTQGEAVG